MHPSNSNHARPDNAAKPPRVPRAAMLWAGALTLAGCVIAACGGIAVVDGDSSNGGAGGTGGAGGNATTSSQGMTIGVTSTTTSGGNSLCDPACTSLTACSNTDGCIQGCESQQGPCGELHQNWMSCSLGETNTMCGFGPGTICLPELGEYVNCQGMLELGPCQGGPNGDCQCFAVINGGESFLDQFCEPGQGCLCLRDGEVIGECEPGQEICGIVDGCCAGVFFTQGI